MSVRHYSEYVGHLQEIVHKPLTKNSKGGVVCYFLPNMNTKTNMRIQLQRDNGVKCKAPFGVSSFDDPNSTRKTLELSIDDEQLVKFFQDFDEKNVDFAMQNASQWFSKQKDLTRDQVKSMYYPMLTYDTTDKGYPPRLHTKLSVDGRNKVNVLLFSENEAGVGQYSKGSIDDIVKYSELIVIVEAASIWFQSKQFGVTLQVTDVVVFPKAERKEFPFIWSGNAPTAKVTDSVVLCAPAPATESVASASVLLRNEEPSNGVTLLPLADSEPASKKQRVASKKS